MKKAPPVQGSQHLTVLFRGRCLEKLLTWQRRDLEPFKPPQQAAVAALGGCFIRGCARVYPAGE